MAGRRMPMGRYKTCSVKVKQSRKRRATVRPFGYQVANYRWPAFQRDRHFEYSDDLILLRDTVLGLCALFAFLWALFRMMLDAE